MDQAAAPEQNTASTSMTGVSASVWAQQSRRGPASVSSGIGERTLDLMVGVPLVVSGLAQVLRGHAVRGTLLAAGGTWLTSAGLTGRFAPYAAMALVRSNQDSRQGLIVEKSVTIGRPVADVYAVWRNLKQLPELMPNLIRVDEHPSGRGARTRWVAWGPLGLSAAWEAEITDERENERIAWRSTADTAVPNSGEVRFREAPGGRGTEVHVRLEYQPPLGTLGAAFARIFREEPNQQLRQDLRRLKAVLETGEAPTTDGQPHGPRVSRLRATAMQAIARIAR